MDGRVSTAVHSDSGSIVGIVILDIESLYLWRSSRGDRGVAPLRRSSRFASRSFFSSSRRIHCDLLPECARRNRLWTGPEELAVPAPTVLFLGMVDPIVRSSKMRNAWDSGVRLDWCVSAWHWPIASRSKGRDDPDRDGVSYPSHLLRRKWRFRTSSFPGGPGEELSGFGPIVTTSWPLSGPVAQ